MKARSAHPAYPARAEVVDANVSWQCGAADYHPTEFTHPVVFANDITLKPGGWADPADPANPAIDWSTRESFEGAIRFTAGGSAPTNPRGRTGMHGRGLLGKWGPNHAADPIVTRFDPSRPDRLQVVAIKRKDTGDWALPGGMVDSGELVSLTVKREFEEEVGNLAMYPEQQAQFKVSLEALFERGKEIYRGYVDDPRNTDNAWMETTAFHFHCTDALARRLPLRAGDDAGDVMWLDVDPANAKFANLYASHRVWVEDAATSLDRNPGSRIVRAARKSLLPLIQCVCSVAGVGRGVQAPVFSQPKQEAP